MIVVSHYTASYAEHAYRLVASLLRFGYLHEVFLTPDCGSWAANCRIRAAFIMGRRIQHPAAPLLWVDADGEFLDRARDHFRPPEPCDIGVHFHHLDRRPSPGTLYVAPTAAAWQFLNEWNMEIQRLGTEDKAAFPAAAARVPKLRIWRMPESLCFIRDLAKDPDAPVVVEHHQASRTMRKAKP